jgi:hypothetical protein
MNEMGNRACLSAKGLNIVTRQLGVEHFDCGLGPQMNVLTEVDFGKPALSQQICEAIVTELLSNTVGAICHLCLCGSACNV